MSNSKKNYGKQILTSLSIAVAIALLLAITAATPPPAKRVNISPFGYPEWKPVDFHFRIHALKPVIYPDSAETLPAVAATVEKYEGVFDDTFPIDCGSFEAILHAVSYYQGTVMFDQEGNLVRDQTQWFLMGSITNTTTGETVYVNDRVNTQVNTDKELWMTTGTFESITVPGEGSVSLFNGKFLFDLETFEMTLHLGPQQGNICAAVD